MRGFAGAGWGLKAMDRIHILIVDDHAMFRDGLRAVLEPQEDMSLVGEADDPESGIRLAAELRPDVILMDLHLPGRSGVEATREILARQPSVKVMALTMHHGDSLVDAMIMAGAQGYVLKEARAAELLEAIRAVAAGGAAMDPGVTSQVLVHYRQVAPGTPTRVEGDFSARELTLLRLLAKGATNRRIAASLHLSEQTVKNLLSGLYAKLGVSSRMEAVAIALRKGTIQQEP